MTIKAATTTLSAADFRQKDSVTTGLTTIGQEVNATRPMDTTIPMDTVMSPTITVRTSLPLIENAFRTDPRRTTAVHVACSTGSCIPVHAITTPRTAHNHCFSPAMASATKTALQRRRKPSVVERREKLSTTKAAISVISLPDYVPPDTSSTVSATFTDQPSTRPARAGTSADTTPTADAIITRVTVRTAIIPLTVSAIVALANIRRRRVRISADITRTTARPAEMK